MRQLLSIALCLLLLTISVSAITGNGSISSELYSFEQDSVKQYRFYQSLHSRFILSQQGYKRITFTSNARWRTDFKNKRPNDPQLFVYDAQLQFKDVIHKSQFSIGRQFRYSNVGSALIDGITVKSSLIPNSDLSLFAGAGVDRLDPEKIQNFTDNLIIGSRYGYKLQKNYTLGLNWFLQKENEQITRHRFGLDGRVKFDRMSIYSRVSYDVSLLTINELLIRTGYSKDNWQVLLEGRYREPLVTSNSLFAIIDAEKYKRVRADIQYKINRTVRLITQIRYSIYENDNSIAGTIGFRTPQIALYYNFQNGRGSENNGLSGTFTHKLNSATYLYASANLSRYRIQEEYEDLSDAYSVAVGGSRTFSDNWQVRSEWQYLRNAVESYSSRIYFKLSKQFSIR